MRQETSTIEMWDEKTIKSYWCDLNYPIDIKNLELKRHRHFDSCRWYYDETRLIPLDTHNPGNFSTQYVRTKAYCDEVFQKWESIPGHPVAKLNTTVSIKNKRATNKKNSSESAPLTTQLRPKRKSMSSQQIDEFLPSSKKARGNREPNAK
jgi:hypothetical protein